MGLTAWGTGVLLRISQCHEDEVRGCDENDGGPRAVWVFKLVCLGRPLSHLASLSTMLFRPPCRAGKAPPLQFLGVWTGGCEGLGCGPSRERVWRYFSTFMLLCTFECAQMLAIRGALYWPRVNAAACLPDLQARPQSCCPAFPLNRLPLPMTPRSSLSSTNPPGARQLLFPPALAG